MAPRRRARPIHGQVRDSGPARSAFPARSSGGRPGMACKRPSNCWRTCGLLRARAIIGSSDPGYVNSGKDVLAMRSVTKTIFVLGVFWIGVAAIWLSFRNPHGAAIESKPAHTLSSVSANERKSETAEQQRAASSTPSDASPTQGGLPSPPSSSSHTSGSPVATRSSAPHQDSGAPPSPPKPASQLLANFIERLGHSAFQSPITQGHTAMLAEQPDPSWSPAASNQLNQYLSQQLGDRFEFPVVQCQSNICEIQAAGFPGVSGDPAASAFQEVVGKMHQQPWWSDLGFDEQILSVTDEEGRMLFIVYVTRK